MSGAREKLVDDFVKLVMGAVGTAQGMREEAAAHLRARLEASLRKMDLVTREEFDVVSEMARQALLENEALRTRLEKLEKPGRGAAKPAKRTTRKKPSTAKK